MKRNKQTLSDTNVSLGKRSRLQNTHSRRFIEEARRQSKLVNESPFAEEDQAFVDAISLPLFEEG